MADKRDIGGSRQATFIVRMWTDGTRPGGGVLWRGVVEHVQNGDHKAFQELDFALNFIARRLESEMEPQARGGECSRKLGTKDDPRNMECDR